MFGFLRYHHSCLEPYEPRERAAGAESPRLQVVGAADFRRDLSSIGREKVDGDEATGASMKTKNLGLLLEGTGIGRKYIKRLRYNTLTNQRLYYRLQ